MTRGRAALLALVALVGLGGSVPPAAASNTGDGVWRREARLGIVANDRTESISVMADGDTWVTGFFADWLGGSADLWRAGTNWQNTSLHANRVGRPAAVNANDVWLPAELIEIRSDDYDYVWHHLVFHWDGSGFTTFELPEEAQAVAALSSSDVWALGNAYAAHWDGSTWSPADAPPMAVNAALVASGRVWAVGNDSEGQMRAAEWDGSEWVESPPLGAGTLCGVTVVGGTQFWAVGHSFHGAPIVVRRDASEWSSVGRLPASLGPVCNISADSANDVWVSGRNDTSGGVARWDGAHWHGVDLRADGIGVVADMAFDGSGDLLATGAGTDRRASVWRLSPIPLGGSVTDVALSLGRSRWLRADRSDHRLDDGGFGVLSRRTHLTGEVFALTGKVAATVLARDGGNRVVVSAPPDASPAVVDPRGSSAVRWALQSVRGRRFDVRIRRPGASSFALWRSRTSRTRATFHPDAGPGVYEVEARVWDEPGLRASGWSPAARLRVRSEALSVPYWQVTEPHLLLDHDVTLGPQLWSFGYASQPVYATTAPDNVWSTDPARWDGHRWRDVPAPTGYSPSASVQVATSGPRDAWLLTGAWPGDDEQRLDHWDGRRWATMAVPAPALSIAASSSSDAWVGGETFRHWDGVQWTEVPAADAGEPLEFYQLAAFSPVDAWAVGVEPYPRDHPGTVVEHWDGERWSIAYDGRPGAEVAWLGAGGASRDLWFGLSDAQHQASFLHWDGRGFEPVYDVHRMLTGSPYNPSSDVVGSVALPSGQAYAAACCLSYDSGVLLRLDPMRVGRHGFRRPLAWVRQGRTVVWRVSLNAHGRHSITDASGIGLFDSGRRRPGASFLHRFDAAASYTAVDRVTGRTALIQVPILDTQDGLQIAAASLPAGVVADVQVQLPGSTQFTSYEHGTTDLLVPRPSDPGTYLFRARLRSVSTGRSTGWSPVRTVSLG
jgi:WD40 repeat protein